VVALKNRPPALKRSLPYSTLAVLEFLSDLRPRCADTD
jgi:hypothetical protein